MTALVMTMALWAVASQPAKPGPTLEQVRNATYRGIFDAPITLRKGEYEGPAESPDSAVRPTAMLLDRAPVYGDLNGDGKTEAVVLIQASGGGSGAFTYVAVVGLANGKTVNLATELVGDREPVESLAVKGRTIVMDVIGHGPTDPMCCPTQRQVRTWELVGKTLKLRRAEARRDAGQTVKR